MTTAIKAIETKYKGYRFRSRLEARYAVMFDALGIKWEYEKEGYDLSEYGWYLPDFYLPERKLWIEVKGQQPTDIEESKAFQLSNGTDIPILIVGDLGTVWKAYYRHTDEIFTIPIPSVISPQMLYICDFETYRLGEMICCPICNCDYVNFAKPKECNGEDNYKAWNGRGNAIKIYMQCESGCSWTLVMGFHKGQTFMGVENPTKRIRDPLAAILGERTKIDNAINVARSARFEHGETPI